MKLLVKIIPSLLLFISSGLKFIYAEKVEFSIIETGLFSWSTALFSINSIIILEFFLGVSLLFKTTHIRLISLAILLLSFLYLLNFFNQPADCLHTNRFLFYLPNKWMTLTGIISLILFSTINLIRSEERPNNKRKKNVLLNILFLVIISIPTFIINPIFINDFQGNNAVLKTPTLNWNKVFTACENSNINIDHNQTTFFAFLSTSCYYCNQSAIKMGISGRATQHSPKIVLVFPGNKKDTEEFIERNHCDFPYVRISKDEFRSLAGNEFPAFFKVKNKKETHYFTGKTFDYRELDKLFELN